MIIGDINSSKDLDRATKNINTVFHFAASADLNHSNRKPFETIESNIIGTVKILKACLKNNVKKLFMLVLYTQGVNKEEFIVRVNYLLR